MSDDADPDLVPDPRYVTVDDDPVSVASAFVIVALLIAVACGPLALLLAR